MKNEQVLRIMMLSRLTSDRRQSDTREFAAGWSKTGANLLAAQPVRPDFQHPFAGNSGSTGLRSGESPYPLRT
jgi:hypothetical protein